MQKETDEHYRNGFLGHIVLITTKVEEFLSNFDYRPNKVEYLREDVLDEFEVFCEEHLVAEKERTSKVMQQMSGFSVRILAGRASDFSS
mmetsp:Transcript_32605/g.127915  ORF Transcript_32605/g.127915 Transcript_32605/m.127915 type:complete len:89 (+) Transcript_32605:1903-2169(+)